MSRLESTIVGTQAFEPHGGAAAHVVAACFGERDMHQRPECIAHVPPAAGLFGVASSAEPLAPLRWAVGRG